MKFALKIFFAVYTVVILTVGTGGLLMTEHTVVTLFGTKIDSAVAANDSAGSMFASLIADDANGGNVKDAEKQLARLSGTANALRVCTLTEVTGYTDTAFSNALAAGQQGYAILSDGSERLQVICRIDSGDSAYYIETLTDLGEIYAQRKQLVVTYTLTVLLTAVISGGVLLLISYLLTRPLRSLSAAARRIAAGDYDAPLRAVSGGDEVARLTADFNTMTLAVRQSVGDLQEALARRDTFIADFTHELKTPMTSIIGWADMLRTYALPEAERRTAAEAIRQEGKRLESLSLQLLDWLVLQQETPPLCTVSAEKLFSRLENATRFLAEKYGVTVALCTEEATLTAAPELLLSLLYNLVDNACKASPAGATVTVTGKRQAGFLITVADRGRGIRPENLQRITEPFFMEDKSRARRQGGAGIGLALCQRIAALHHTKLHYDSTPGVGTTVRFTLPKEVSADA